MRWLLGLLGWIVAGAIVVAVVLEAFVVDTWVVPDDDPLLAASIEPTLRAGDLVLFLRHSDVTRGILVRCVDPDAPGRYVVARAIARFGDRVELRDDGVKLDGRSIARSFECAPRQWVIRDPRSNADVALTCELENYGDFSYTTLASRDAAEPPTDAVPVSEGRWFLVSDDRHIHLDSRDYGQVDPRSCQHIVFRLAGAKGFADAERRFKPIW